MRGDGDGWWFSPDGTRNWGKHGAAGLLLRAPLDDGRPGVLLQHRAVWSHQGGTWALPGGARDSHETTEHAAVREAREEAGIDPSLIRVRTEVVTARAPGGWTYTTVIADTAEPLATSLNQESAELRWVPEDEVDTLPLHPGFELAWPSLRTTPARVVLDGIADAAVLEAALPRTIALPGEGFAWLLALEVNESVQVSGRAQYAQITAVITAAARPGELVGGVFTLSVEEMLAS